MNYTQEVEGMYCQRVEPRSRSHSRRGQMDKKAYEIKDISGFTHGVWAGALLRRAWPASSLNIKEGIIEEAR